MSTVSRNVVFWPRMRVRGRRNRAKLAARYTDRVVQYAVVGNACPESGRVEFITVPAERATHRLVHSQTRDGFGRIVPTPKPATKSTPKPPLSAFPMPRRREISMNLNVAMDPDAARDIFDSILGRAAPRNALVQD
ncbi:hypothetical protein [Microbacterium sp. VKM Ac-2923]|uniref:hypothetical protein n=1 Tax=Microbacterium sp. VKM Ac-2923 TaxID=2929476 RepID=UPI001FB291A1|nr:hypothetical protein [Microbacterium sp. VKM Ac-2923]MCJ1709275.1 hypothetical protein [Microbacterium sp. VKM Ac-2923]